MLKIGQTPPLDRICPYVNTSKTHNLALPLKIMCGYCILAVHAQEFHPYVFQIFSQLIELRPKPLPASYMQMLRPLLSPVLWERSGSVTALVRLMRAYLSKAAEEVVQSGTLTVSSSLETCEVAGMRSDPVVVEPA